MNHADTNVLLIKEYFGEKNLYFVPTLAAAPMVQRDSATNVKSPVWGVEDERGLHTLQITSNNISPQAGQSHVWATTYLFCGGRETLHHGTKWPLLPLAVHILLRFNLMEKYKMQNKGVMLKINHNCPDLRNQTNLSRQTPQAEEEEAMKYPAL
jgi:hypothetical protein